MMASRTSSRRATIWTWVVIGVTLIAVGSAGAVITQASQTTTHDRLDPQSAAPGGAQALARVLSDQGVDVIITHSYLEATNRLNDGPATLVLPDTPALSDDAITSLAAASADLVLVDPRARSLRLIAPDARAVGVADDSLISPDCFVDDATRAGAIRPHTVFDSAAAARCYPAAGGYAVLVAPRPNGRAVAVDGMALFTNEVIASDGNAALALNLLGARDRLIWYVPSLADSDLEPLTPSLGDLTPPWVTPAIVLLLAAGVTAALWRGIRFGPLVSERLPVVVRGEETTRGRAYLYRRSRDYGHQANLLRRGACTRIARTLGLASTASAEEIAAALAQASGLSASSVHDVLAGPAPTNSRDLEALPARLEHLELAARTALHPERTAP